MVHPRPGRSLRRRSHSRSLLGVACWAASVRLAGATLSTDLEHALCFAGCGAGDVSFTDSVGAMDATLVGAACTADGAGVALDGLDDYVAFAAGVLQMSICFCAACGTAYDAGWTSGSCGVASGACSASVSGAGCYSSSAQYGCSCGT